MMLLILFIKSSTSLDKQRMAINSLATVMTNSSCLGATLVSPSETVTFLKALSFISRALFQRTLSGLIFNSLPCQIELSIQAAIKLIELVRACMSPVKCKLISSLGTTRALPPPVAPPLIPKTGPRDGSLKHTNEGTPI